MTSISADLEQAGILLKGTKTAHNPFSGQDLWIHSPTWRWSADSLSAQRSHFRPHSMPGSECKQPFRRVQTMKTVLQGYLTRPGTHRLSHLQAAPGLQLLKAAQKVGGVCATTEGHLHQLLPGQPGHCPGHSRLACSQNNRACIRPPQAADSSLSLSLTAQPPHCLSDLDWQDGHMLLIPWDL